MTAPEPATPRVAIIGAGICGLAVASVLRDGADLVVFEKSRGLGGRMSTRRHADFRFDHGTRAFSVRGGAFSAFMLPHVADGSCMPWVPRRIQGQDLAAAGLDQAHVAVPTMNAICKQLAQGLDVRLQVQVAPLGSRTAGGWVLSDTGGEALGCFDWVVCTAPAPQTLNLLGGLLPDPDAVTAVRMLPAHALMVGMTQRWDHPWDLLLPANGPINWISVDSSKPGRPGGVTSLLAQTDALWSQANLEAEPGALLPFLLSVLASEADVDVRLADYKQVHRWRYASVDQLSVTDIQCDTRARLAAGGDWCRASTVGAAWSVGIELGQRVLAQL